MHTGPFLDLFLCCHSFMLSFPFLLSSCFLFVLLDSLFFNTPFLDFKRIFHLSCCDGKCDVTSVLTCFAANNMSKKKKERKRLSQ